jgi:hypothetical protein
MGLTRRRLSSALGIVLSVGLLAALRDAGDSPLNKAYRFDKGGWIFVHLEGGPHEIGYQHGYLLAPEIADGFAAAKLEMTHDTQRDWAFFRQAAHDMLWPKIDPEYQAELQGIVDGLAAHDVRLDLDDVVAYNAFSELPDYYVPWLDAQKKKSSAPRITVPERCSAFVATGSWTKDHQVVMAHNNWTTYIEGSRWRVMFDIAPEHGHRLLMDGFPGIIVSDDDFAVNAAGLMVSETTISDFNGWDPNGKPEFVRARKAMQYAGSIDEFVAIMRDGNNGGYANDWLLGERTTGEVARFELGLKHWKVWRTTDGYFAGSNFPSDPDLIKDETTFDTGDASESANARHVRWDQLMAEHKGQIDTALAKDFISDHYDTYTKKVGPDQRTLCGHEDRAATDPAHPNVPRDSPSGAVEGKAIDSRLAQAMQLVARTGHPCGVRFDAASFLASHKDYAWQAPVLHDMDAGPWTLFQAGERPPESRVVR